MAESRTVKIRVPSKIEAGKEFQVRALVVHPMEIVRRDKNGKVIEKAYNYVHTISAAFNGKEVMRGEITQAVSANPMISFPMTVKAPGKLVITFEDTTGAKHSGRVDIKF